MGTRYRLEQPDGSWWELGWDRPLATFYAQRFSRGHLDPLDEPELLAWHGTDFGELATVDALADRLPLRIPGNVAQGLAADAREFPSIGEPPFLATASAFRTQAMATAPELQVETAAPAAATHLYERFLPPPDFRGIDPSLYEMRFGAIGGPTPPETLRAWDAAAAACRERDAAHAMHFAEEHLRGLAPVLMANYDAQRAVGTDPVPAMAIARAELQQAAMEALCEELGIEAAERGLSGRARDDWVERQLDDLTDPYTALPPPGRAAVALAGEYRGIASWEAAMTPNPAIGVFPAELVNRPAPLDAELGALLAAGDHAGLCEFAEALGDYRDQLWDRAQALVAEERAVAALVSPAAPAPGDVVEVPPAAMAEFLAALVVETGDDISTLAPSLGVDPDWARGVLTGEVTEIDDAHLDAMCAALHSAREQVFGPTAPTTGFWEPADVDLAPSAETTPVHQLVDTAGFLRAGELLVEVDAMGPDERAELVRALATRHSQAEAVAEELTVREEMVAARLQVPTPITYHPAAALGLAGDLPLSAAAAAAQIEILVTDTGDDLDTVARGLGLEPAWVHDVAAGTVDTVDADHARRLCDALELSPASVFGVAGMALEGPDTAWAVVTFDPFDHELHLELLEPTPPAIDLDFGP